MRRWSEGVTAAVLLVLALGGCRSGDGPDPSPDGPGSPAASAPSPLAPSSSVAPAQQHGVVPAVMLSSVIRTPDGPIHTGIKHPATFIATQTGFVVQDTRGTTYAVEAGDVRRIGRTDPSWVYLVADAGGRYVAFASTRFFSLRVYDSVSHEIVLDGRLATSCGTVGCVWLDEHAAYTHSPEPDSIVQQPFGNRPALAIAESREQTLRALGRLSPTARYTTTLGRHERLMVRTFHGGRDVTPALPDGPVRQLVWLDRRTFTVEVETASLISPPDGEVWHLLGCDVRSGRCTNALTGVTGTALSIPGTPVRSTFGQ